MAGCILGKQYRFWIDDSHSPMSHLNLYAGIQHDDILFTWSIVPIVVSFHPETNDIDTIAFPIRKSAILGKLKEIKGLRGDIRNVCRTRNPVD
ncbi:MAG: hypothetical protein EHM85_04430 [Desulfobacteraceae bacterium]|nr:MAG: hypothetical protein EHM85_04430 [Desulfobacteraceae bacterium]